MAANQSQLEIEQSLSELFADFQPASDSLYSELPQKAIFLARFLQQRASDLQTPQERRQQAELDRMIHNPQDKSTLAQLTDQAFRSRVPARVVDQLTHILDVQGIPRFFSPIDRTLLKGFQSFGSYLPGVAVPLVKEKMHQETANVILPAEQEMLTQHLSRRRNEGVRMNVNFLGEALLGEEEAGRRLQGYLQALQLPEIEVISVKISTIYSQISSLDEEHSVSVLSNRLEHLYRNSGKVRFRRADGREVAKFVYLDLEEYRDLNITAKVFMQTLDRPGLEDVEAGIALQAYIPDSFVIQKQINAWARQRIASGGAPVTIRVVKGANMEMERGEASLRGWPQATYKTKLETDANYKRMLHEGMKPENLEAVRLGIASHNLFDVAYGLVLAWEAGGLDQVQLEMLEGMANHQRRALFQLNRNLLLYAPACKQQEFVNAISYLIRRLDENTGPKNFLRHAFHLQVDSEDWQLLEQNFLDSCDEISQLGEDPRRQQNRALAVPVSPRQQDDWQRFRNEPDTDFCLPANIQWANQILEQWKTRCDNSAVEIPLVIDGTEILNDRPLRQSYDPSRHQTVVARFREASADDIQQAVDCGRRDEDGWRNLKSDERTKILDGVAAQLRQARGDLIGAAVAEAGKTILESDPEVSEAIDFAEFYPRSAHYLQSLDGVLARGKGLVAVISPWNFPIAIPCGGISAALAAGNTVILKPASDTALIAYELCRCFWRAGVSQKTLQFTPCSGAEAGQFLVSHAEVDVVILTGGTETAYTMLSQKPDLNLLAETGGKNATVVTSLADRDQAIKHVIHSAFSHSGQKCSATSLLVLEEEIYDDVKFQQALRDAVSSLPVGSAWDLTTRVGPLIRPPSGALLQGLKELESGESWALLPEQKQHNPAIFSPGVKWGVRPGSFTHNTEFFGPLLGVMKAKDLQQAIDLVNATGYGLTSGLESLDKREQKLWQHSIKAGNLYVNRSTTGAIVLRQPFGGMGKSAFGPGIKAGGPNYVAQLMEFQESGTSQVKTEVRNPYLNALAQHLRQLQKQGGRFPPQEVQRTLMAIASYDWHAREEFGLSHDHQRLVGQDNLRRYFPVRELRIRIHPKDTFFEIIARVCAAKSLDCRITVSLPPTWSSSVVDQLDAWTGEWAGSIEFVEETDEALARVILTGQTDRVRYASRNRVPQSIFDAVAASGHYVAHHNVFFHGRIELLWYLQEQSVCIDYHRYGNLGDRAGQKRQEPL
ncbi:MAG: proline dehydrogenase [Planctomycetaceae bacterium]|nr:proline dehydrogenase [Planctomycetaceae bacterium]MBP60346.1 proline dehydrogenase [Planctomycetaceae bacterium]